MSRAFTILVVLFLTLRPVAAQAITIEPDDIENFSSPCNLSISTNGSVRTMSWSSVSGASTYKVGYRLGDGTIVALAEVTTSSYEHSGWSSGDCLEYVLVACDGGGSKVCAAHVPNVGTGCPQ
jgi:hypothetical protein